MWSRDGTEYTVSTLPNCDESSTLRSDSYWRGTSNTDEKV